MSNFEQRLEDILSKWNLLEHPFYQAWSMGTLPDAHLKLYSAEYASFIGMIAKGWEACGDMAIAKEEMEHYELWKDFSKSLGNEEIKTTVTEVDHLVESCERNYQEYNSALGALYAFERQQPKTAESKLKGLQTHYQHINADETYFEIHVDDEEEPAILLAQMNKLDDSGQETALKACEEVAEGLYNALTGIMKAAEA